MGLSERYARSIIEEELLLPLKPSPPEERLLAPAAVPASFDWRNHNGQDWMTAVHNQRACGSCWAFSAVGTTEAVYNIYTNFPDLDLDLSEEFLNSDCPSPNPGDCCGGGHTSALSIIRDNGIPDEDCLPYDEGYYRTGECRCFPNPPCNPDCDGLPASCSHLNCSDACTDMASRLVTIDSYHYVAAAQIKQNLVDEGPLAVCLAMSGTYDAQNVYRCTTCWDRDGDSVCDPDNGVCVIPPGQTEGTCGGVGWGCTTDADCDEDRNGDGVCDQDDCGTNHCVIIVGYDDAGGYWIVKNSWGNTWSGDGYWEVGYGECHIEDYVHYVEPADINFPPIADANGPYSAECQGATAAVSLDGTDSDDPNAGDTLTYSWTTNCPGGSFDDATSATPILTLNTSASAVCPLTCNVTLTVSDGEESDTDTASVTVEDTTAPTLSGVPADETVECDSVPPPANVTATDNCDPSPTVTFSETRTDGSCPDNYTLTRTWTATDACGNSSSGVQTITVVDTTPPVISLPADVTIECDESADPSNTGTATATDNCDPAPAIAYADVVTPGDCPNEWTITRTWTATDACGNSSSGEQTITVVDTTAPVISCNAPATITPPDAPISFTATATDNCDEDPSVEITGFDCFFFTKKGKRIDKTESCVVEVVGDTITILNTGGVGTHITWTTLATDSCGNFDQVECEVEVVKKGKP